MLWGKDPLINNNPTIRYVNPNTVNSHIIPPTIKFSSDIEKHITSWKSKSNTIPEEHQIQERVNDEMRQIKRYVTRFYKQRGKNFRVFVMVRKEFPFLCGYLKIRREGIIVGFHKGKLITDVTGIQFTPEFSIIPFKDDTKLFTIQANESEKPEFFIFKKEKKPLQIIV